VGRGKADDESMGQPEIWQTGPGRLLGQFLLLRHLERNELQSVSLAVSSGF